MASRKGFQKCGVTYVGQLEHEYMFKHKLGICRNCFAMGWDKPLKRCTGCQLVDYCSKDCQKASWLKHRPFCNMIQGKGVKNGYLTAYQPNQVIRILIDSYRLRVEIDHNQREEDHGIYYPGKWEDGIVWIKGDVTDDFQKYLDLVETVGVLPEWWRFEDRMECFGVAIDTDDKENIFNPVDQNDLISRYGGDTEIRNALCVLAELVVGYLGKGAPETNEWYEGFVRYMEDRPEEKAKLIKGSVEAVEAALQQHGHEIPTTVAT